MQLLRIEGVNLAHSIEDTEDLSTRRGGSLMLLEVIDEIEKQMGANLKRISTGASAGIFEVTGNAEATIKGIESLLISEPYCYGTFTLDTVDADSDFPALERAAVAANRWRQMQSLSFSPIGLSSGDGEVCDVDEVRPAQTSKTGKGQAQQISASVKSRRDHGLDAKRRFYRRILGDHYANLKFTDDFGEISDGSDLGLNPRTLNGKLAIFYADGNDFGKIARSAETPEDLRKWDDYIKGQRKALLAAILDHAAKRKHWQASADKVRLETLLWGGDELMFAVPGWCGMELAQHFFEQTRGMEYPIKKKESENRPQKSKKEEDEEIHPLTHACGLVLCHHQAPISRISNLAKALADKGKANRDVNSLNWLVLESFDHTGSGLNDYLLRRFGPGMSWSELALNLDALKAMIEDFASLREQLPRSAIVRITRALAERRAFDSEGKEMPLIRRARFQVADAGGEAFKSLWPRLHPKATPWDDDSPSCDDLGASLKLAELWDYCPNWTPPPAEEGIQQ